MSAISLFLVMGKENKSSKLERSVGLISNRSALLFVTLLSINSQLKKICEILSTCSPGDLQFGVTEKYFGLLCNYLACDIYLDQQTHHENRSHRVIAKAFFGKLEMQIYFITY